MAKTLSTNAPEILEKQLIKRRKRKCGANFVFVGSLTLFWKAPADCKSFY